MDTLLIESMVAAKRKLRTQATMRYDHEPRFSFHGCTECASRSVIIASMLWERLSVGGGDEKEKKTGAESWKAKLSYL